MSVLILEDSPTRIKLFKQGFVGTSTTILTKASLAVSWLKGCTPRLICLDYDLDQYGEDLKEAGTGFEAATYIARENKRFSRTLIIVHSLNEKWAAKMVRLLTSHKLSASRHPNLWESQLDMERLAKAVREMDITP
jgi:CheY-like chemotaxis protein